MIYFNRTDKTLIIPDGIGNGSIQSYENGVADGKATQKAIDDAKITPSLTITENGQYTADYGYKTVNVNIEGPQGCQGVYDEGYQAGYEVGYEEGAGSQGCQGVYDEGYQSGYQGGYSDGYTEGETAGEQGGYQTGYDDGYQGGYVAGNTDGYQTGEAAGIAEQKAKLVSTAITVNGTYSRADGWSAVTVNVPNNCSEAVAEAYAQGVSEGKTAGYNSGYTAGGSAQKALLASTAFTENGTYTRADGWSAVTVNVNGGTGGNVQQMKDYKLTSGDSNYVRIYPDSGYDAMYVCRVDCDDLYHLRWEEGKDYARSQMGSVTLTGNGVYNFGTNDNLYYGVSSVTVSVDTSTGYSFTQYVFGTLVLNSPYDFSQGPLLEGSDALNEATIDEYLQADLVHDGTTLPAGEYGFIFCLNYGAGLPMPWFSLNDATADVTITSLGVSTGV